MRSIVFQVTEATDGRIQRIKELRTTPTGYVMNEQEVIQAAIALYWSACEMRNLATNAETLMTSRRLRRAIPE